MLGDIYYFFTLILIIFNVIFIGNFFKYYKIVEWFHTFKKVTGRIPNKEDFEKDDFELNSFLSSVIIFNLTWIFFGILSKSWVIFLFLLGTILLVLILQSILSIFLGKFSLISKIINLIFWIYLTSILSILTINHFHLHLELSKYLFGFFS